MLFSNIASFRKANVECMARIHKKSSEQLLGTNEEEQVQHK